MSLIPKMAAIEMHRVAEQHQQSTEASHRRTAETVYDQLNDLTDDHIELAEKHTALKKRHASACSLICSLVNKSDGYKGVLSDLYPPAAMAEPGTLSREAVHALVNEKAKALKTDQLHQEKIQKDLHEFLSRAEKGRTPSGTR